MMTTLKKIVNFFKCCVELFGTSEMISFGWIVCLCLFALVFTSEVKATIIDFFGLVFLIILTQAVVRSIYDYFLDVRRRMEVDRFMTGYDDKRTNVVQTVGEIVVETPVKQDDKG